MPATSAIASLAQIDPRNMPLGHYSASHMLQARYTNGQWGSLEVVPFGPLALSPNTLALHYGQSVFEGMKAFRDETRPAIHLFRPQRHFARFNQSLDRMAMPEIDPAWLLTGMDSLLRADAAWVPHPAAGALYIRPFMFASEARLGVKVSEEYTLLVVSGPSNPLYSKPIRVKVETEYSRAAPGGTGSAKCAGNYGGAFKPTRLARQQGYDQVLWTDACSHSYLEESGTMNVMVLINNVLHTPPLSGSILDGITRDSLLTLGRDLGFEVKEAPVAVAALEAGLKDGSVQEVFGTGTAAVVTEIGTVGIAGTDYTVPPSTPTGFLQQASSLLHRIRTGQAPDTRGWNHTLADVSNTPLIV